ncbi:creatinine amidohydrolase [Halohasta litchfieldiae]|jgi:creatinine amidohydrolase|uniref:Creatinine amidohydrolase n=1 Tax=Halohasta litchfieldiae TaxID=1073996 RepID=A0A1H6UCF8_9EURY|nr:creatininase family protein [Halohasta litchfieldiae]ATW87111.1 creatinine amidohydrolase [Halohasta litchfieldiae]SEI85532.1 creatinine amidohydrolase [Halohasta litchfieldiae]
MHLSEVAWPEVRDLDTDLAVVPVGSTEQHGPHAPLGTDMLTAEGVATAGVEAYKNETGVDIPITPTIPVGIAEEHAAFDGTLWVSPDTFRDYVRETVASLAHHGFDRVVIVNGHGGNTDALREVTGEISRHDDAYAVAFTWFDSVDSELSMGHGGPRETAVLRHIRPDLINEDEIDTASEGASDHWGEWVAGVNLAHDSVEFTENGVVGDPTEGTAELGEALIDDAADALCDLLGAVAVRDRSP